MKSLDMFLIVAFPSIFAYLAGKKDGRGRG